MSFSQPKVKSATSDRGLSSYYDEVYAGSHRRTLKYEWSTRGWGIPTATFGTESHELHRTRRAAVSPFFSKASVYALEPVVQSVVDKLTTRLHSLQGTGNVINLVHVFSALTADVIVQYAFAKPYGFVEREDWAAGWHGAVMDASETWHVFKQFAWMEPMVRRVPKGWVERMNPKMGSLFGILQVGAGCVFACAVLERLEDADGGSVVASTAGSRREGGIGYGTEAGGSEDDFL